MIKRLENGLMRREADWCCTFGPWYSPLQFQSPRADPLREKTEHLGIYPLDDIPAAFTSAIGRILCPRGLGGVFIGSTRYIDLLSSFMLLHAYAPARIRVLTHEIVLASWQRLIIAPETDSNMSKRRAQRVSIAATSTFID
jgi:hypothetical protein